MNDVGTTTGELVCEVRVNGFDVARLPRVLAAADRYAAAWQAHEAATTARRASYDVWREAKRTPEGDAAFDAAAEAQRVARAEMNAALAGLERAARGER